MAGSGFALPARRSGQSLERMFRRFMYHFARLSIIAAVLTVIAIVYLNTRRTSVVVENATGSTLASVVVRSSSCGRSSEYAVGELAPNRSRSIRIKICGEGDAAVSAAFPDGRMISGRPDYITTGSTQRHIVKRDEVEISSEYAL
jgi:hypothetical protein